VLSTVGSTNIDYWSFFYDDEENAVILGNRFASEMEDMFIGDLKESDEIRLKDWEGRPVAEKIKEWLGHLLAEWL
jgi:cardiolipin synthase